MKLKNTSGNHLIGFADCRLPTRASNLILRPGDEVEAYRSIAKTPSVQALIERGLLALVADDTGD